MKNKETYTVRPEGMTAWAEHIGTGEVGRVYRQAQDAGLCRLLVVRDSDGVVVSPHTLMPMEEER